MSKLHHAAGIKGAIWDEEHDLPGLTMDGKGVIRNIFMSVDTYGLPLSIIVDHLRSMNAVVNWEDFVKSALAHGWSLGKLKALLIEVGIDCFEDVEERRQFTQRCGKLLSGLQESPG